jgi:hypothetical protein
MRPIYLTRALVAADADGIALAQNLAAAGNLTLNGTFVAGGIADLSAQRKVLFTAGGGDDLSGINFTIRGRNSANIPISEVVVGPVDAAPTSTVLDYEFVDSITASAAFPAGETVEVGTDGTGASQPIPLDIYLKPFQVTLAVKISAADTVDVTVEYTMDDVQASQGPFEWFELSGLTDITESTVDSLISPVTAIRMVTNSGTDEATLQIIQAGLLG